MAKRRSGYKVEQDDYSGKWYVYIWRPRFAHWSGIKAFETREEAEAEMRRYEQNDR